MDNISAESAGSLESYELVRAKESITLTLDTSETIVLNEKAIFYVSENAQGVTVISVQGTKIPLDSNSFEKVELSENYESIPFIEDGTIVPTSELRLNKSVSAYNNTDEGVAVLQEGITLKIYGEDDASYKFLLGNTELHVKKDEIIPFEDKDSQENQSAVEANESSVSENVLTEETDKEDASGSIENQDVETTDIPAMENNLTSKESVSQPASNEKLDNTIQSSSRIDTNTAKTSVTGDTLKVSSFTASDQFFRADTDLPIYENQNGSLVKIGNLTKGQVYKRIGELSNWHKISVGNITGYVYKPGSQPASNNLTNLNTSKNSTVSITIKAVTPVYDNSAGMVKFANLIPGVKITIIGESGNWFSVNVGGRTGYIYKGNAAKDFTASDVFFKATDNVPIYDNRSGELVKIGNLTAGQVYKRTGELSNWHKITVGDFSGFIHKSGTEPATNNLTNLNQSKNTSLVIKTKGIVPVYDNSKGMTKFANFVANVSLPVLGDHGNWYSVDVGGRVGYIYKPSVTREFTSSDQFFSANDNLPIYDNRSGILTKVGNLMAGQTYKRTGELSNWHKISFGNITGYVLKKGTEPSAYRPSNMIDGQKNTEVIVRVKTITPVYDNTAGMEKFANIEPGVSLPVLGEMANWYSIDIGGRVGYIYKANVDTGKVIHQIPTIYNYSLNDMVNIQMGLNDKPQTDLYRGRLAYISADDEYISTNADSGFPRDGIISATALNIRDGKTLSSHIYGQLKAGQKVRLLSYEDGWYTIELPYGWYNAKREDVEKYVNPANVDLNSSLALQFLLLSKSSNVYENELNLLLMGKGILEGKGNAFAQASKTYNINEVYLISHALLETGNGTSELSNGVLVDTFNGQKVTPKVVYNMYGIGAFDGCAVKCGSEYAYEAEWFTPEEAIVGGAAFVAEKYVHNSKDTLYKMRWNPENPGTSQYATDIGWAYKQVNTMNKLYSMINNYTLYYDIPVFS